MPRLHKPCSLVITDRPTASSTRTPTAFIPTSAWASMKPMIARTRREHQGLGGDGNEGENEIDRGPGNHGRPASTEASHDETAQR